MVSHSVQAILPKVERDTESCSLYKQQGRPVTMIKEQSGHAQWKCRRCWREPGRHPFHPARGYGGALKAPPSGFWGDARRSQRFLPTQKVRVLHHKYNTYGLETPCRLSMVIGLFLIKSLCFWALCVAYCGQIVYHIQKWLIHRRSSCFLKFNLNFNQLCM